MKVAITGANGLFAHALVQVIGAKHHALPMTRADADLTQVSQVRHVLLAARPDAIVHTAGAPDPDKCETNPEYAFQTNVVATRLADGSRGIHKDAGLREPEIRSLQPVKNGKPRMHKGVPGNLMGLPVARNLSCVFPGVYPTVMVSPSNFVRLKPPNCSGKVAAASLSTSMATFSPIIIPCRLPPTRE